jgi:hypothetical protein
VGETAEQIETLIDEQRERLDSDVQQLQRQLRSMVDWRIQVRRHPVRVAATVFVGAYLLGITLGRLIRAI